MTHEPRAYVAQDQAVCTDQALKLYVALQQRCTEPEQCVAACGGAGVFLHG